MTDMEEMKEKNEVKSSYTKNKKGIISYLQRRYENDEEFRNNKIENNRINANNKYKNDPEYAEKRREYNRKNSYKYIEIRKANQLKVKAEKQILKEESKKE
jgi:hypothetical protein